MKNASAILFCCFVFTSCVNTKKTIELTNGNLISQNQYDRILRHAFKSAEKEARKVTISTYGKQVYKEVMMDFTGMVVIDTSNTQ